MSHGSISTGLNLLGGVGAGALLMYLFDPKEGPRRRKGLTAAAEHALHSTEGSLASSWDSLAGHAQAIGQTIAQHAHAKGDGSEIAAAAQRLADYARQIGHNVSQKAAEYANSATDAASKAGDLAADYSSRAGKAAAGYTADARKSVSAQAGKSHDVIADYAARAEKYVADASRYVQAQAEKYGGKAASHFAPESRHTSAAAGAGVGVTAVGAVALGLGAIYLLDPEHGAQRREELTRKLSDTVGATGDGLSTTANYIREQATVLIKDVQEKLGAAPARRNEDQPKYDTSFEFSPASGSKTPAAGHPETWSPTSRLLVGIAGGALGFYGAVRRDWVGLGAGAVGLGLVAVGIAKLNVAPLTDAISHAASGAAQSASEAWQSAQQNISTAKDAFTNRGPIEVQKTIEIAAPIDRVFQFWSRYSNFSRFIPDIKEVVDNGGGRSKWTMEGPGSIPIRWDALETDRTPNQVISWESVPESTFWNRGSVHFEEAGEGHTRVRVDFAYAPPAGSLGHAVARLFGSDPETELDKGLSAVKNELEHTTSTADTVAESGAAANV